MSGSGPGEPLPPPEPGAARSFLGLTTLLVVMVLVVGGAWRYAHQGIADNTARIRQGLISAVLPPDLYDNVPALDAVQIDTGAGEVLPVYRARRHGIPVAAVLTVIAPDGYAGPIRLLVGVSADGKLLGVRIEGHMETPGIGAVIAAEGSPWLAGLVGRSLTDPPETRWTIRNDGGEFDAIAGATTSSRAVIGGVRRAMRYFATHRAEIFATPAARTAPR